MAAADKMMMHPHHAGSVGGERDSAGGGGGGGGGGAALEEDARSMVSGRSGGSMTSVRTAQSALTINSMASSAGYHVRQRVNLAEMNPNEDYAIMWVADEHVSHCMLCQAEFSVLWNRKHHCRQCGKVVCGQCSPARMPVRGLLGVQRVCRTCAGLIIAMEAERRKDLALVEADEPDEEDDDVLDEDENETQIDAVDAADEEAENKSINSSSSSKNSSSSSSNKNVATTASAATSATSAAVSTAGRAPPTKRERQPKPSGRALELMRMSTILTRLSDEQRQVFWRSRDHFLRYPHALPFFVSAVVDWSDAEQGAAFCQRLIPRWKPLDSVVEVLHVLFAAAHVEQDAVCQFAVTWFVTHMNEEKARAVLPQLCLMLLVLGRTNANAETDAPHAEQLRRFLVRTAAAYPVVVGVPLYWQAVTARHHLLHALQAQKNAGNSRHGNEEAAATDRALATMSRLLQDLRETQSLRTMLQAQHEVFDSGFEDAATNGGLLNACGADRVELVQQSVAVSQRFRDGSFILPFGDRTFNMLPSKSRAIVDASANTSTIVLEFENIAEEGAALFYTHVSGLSDVNDAVDHDEHNHHHHPQQQTKLQTHHPVNSMAVGGVTHIALPHELHKAGEHAAGGGGGGLAREQLEGLERQFRESQDNKGEEGGDVHSDVRSDANSVAVSDGNVNEGDEGDARDVMSRDPEEEAGHAEMHGPVYRLLFRRGCDLRVESAVLQVVSFISEVCHASELDLQLQRYRCAATGIDAGVLEVVPQSVTLIRLHQLAASMGDDPNACLVAYLRSHNQEDSDMQAALETLARSAAGWTVALAVLGLRDRTPANVLITRRGRLFCMGFDQCMAMAAGAFHEERIGVEGGSTGLFCPREVVVALGGISGELFLRYVHFCGKAFALLRAFPVRQHLINLIAMASASLSPHGHTDGQLRHHLYDVLMLPQASAFDLAPMLRERKENDVDAAAGAVIGTDAHEQHQLYEQRQQALRELTDEQATNRFITQLVVAAREFVTGVAHWAPALSPGQQRQPAHPPPPPSENTSNATPAEPEPSSADGQQHESGESGQTGDNVPQEDQPAATAVGEDHADVDADADGLDALVGGMQRRRQQHRASVAEILSMNNRFSDDEDEDDDDDDDDDDGDEEDDDASQASSVSSLSSQSTSNSQPKQQQPQQQQQDAGEVRRGSRILGMFRRRSKPDVPEVADGFGAVVRSRSVSDPIPASPQTRARQSAAQMALDAQDETAGTNEDEAQDNHARAPSPASLDEAQGQTHGGRAAAQRRDSGLGFSRIFDRRVSSAAVSASTEQARAALAAHAAGRGGAGGGAGPPQQRQSLFARARSSFVFRRPSASSAAATAAATVNADPNMHRQSHHHHHRGHGAAAAGGDQAPGTSRQRKHGYDIVCEVCHGLYFSASGRTRRCAACRKLSTADSEKRKQQTQAMRYRQCESCQGVYWSASGATQFCAACRRDRASLARIAKAKAKAEKGQGVAVSVSAAPAPASAAAAVVAAGTVATDDDGPVAAVDPPEGDADDV